jgi:hypothetical protein
VKVEIFVRFSVMVAPRACSQPGTIYFHFYVLYYEILLLVYYTNQNQYVLHIEYSTAQVENRIHNEYQLLSKDGSKKPTQVGFLFCCSLEL